MFILWWYRYWYGVGYWNRQSCPEHVRTEEAAGRRFKKACSSLSKCDYHVVCWLQWQKMRNAVLKGPCPSQENDATVMYLPCILYSCLSAQYPGYHSWVSAMLFILHFPESINKGFMEYIIRNTVHNHIIHLLKHYCAYSLNTNVT